MKLGYARVSTSDQSVDRQIDELKAAGCDRIFHEAASGKRGANRPQWDKVLDMLRDGDFLVVTELSRLGRNTGDLGRLLDDLDERTVGLVVLNLGIDTSTPGGRLVYNVVAAVAQMERELLVERTQSGLKAARTRGRNGGRRPTLSPAQVKRAQQLYDEQRLTVAEIAAKLGVSRQTIYRVITVSTGAKAI